MGARVLLAYQTIARIIDRTIVGGHSRRLQTQGALDTNCVKDRARLSMMTSLTSGTKAVPKRAVRDGYTQSYKSAPRAEQTSTNM